MLNVHSAMKGMDAVAAIGASGMSDMDQLSKWITQSRLDPNDPSNADLMYLMKVSSSLFLGLCRVNSRILNFSMV